jgi:HEAT repeat protein
MIEDESVQVRAAAVESLSKVGNLKPQLLLDKLRNSKGNLKVNLIRAMGQLKNEMFLKPLIDELKDRKSMFFTIDALGDLGFAEAEIPLRRILKDAEWFNRLNALEALAKLPLPSLGQIAQEQAQDENDMVRNSAARILASKQKMNGA